MGTFRLRKAGGGSTLRGGDLLQGSIPSALPLVHITGVAAPRTQPGVSRFTRPDVVVVSVDIPFDLVAKHSGHAPRLDRARLSRFIRPDAQVVLSIPPDLIHRTGAKQRKPRQPVSRFFFAETPIVVLPVPGLSKSGPSQGHTHVGDLTSVSESVVSSPAGPTRSGGTSDKSRVGD